MSSANAVVYRRSSVMLRLNWITTRRKLVPNINYVIVENAFDVGLVKKTLKTVRQGRKKHAICTICKILVSKNSFQNLNHIFKNSGNVDKNISYIGFSQCSVRETYILYRLILNVRPSMKKKRKK